MDSGKKAADFLQLLDNHIFFNDLDDQLLQFFFKSLVKKDLDHGYDEEGNLINGKLLKKKMFEYLFNDTKLLMENIPKVQLIIATDPELTDEGKIELKLKLEKKVSESNERLKKSDIGNIINEQFEIFTS